MIANYGFHATMTAQPGKGDALVELLLNGTTSGPAAHDDCVVFLVSRSASNPDVVHLTEGWTSEEAHDRVFATDEAQVYIARFGELVDGETQYVDEVPVGGKALLTPPTQRDEEVKG
jgi:quinol monooxygenase YgiN